MPEDELESIPSTKSIPKSLGWGTGGDTYKHRLREGEDLIFGQESVLILVMDIKEPFDVIHQVIKHHPIQS